MIIPKADPMYIVANIALSQVKNFADQLFEQRDQLSTNLSNQKNTEETLREMIFTTTLEMMKNEIFYPEEEEKVDW